MLLDTIQQEMLLRARNIRDHCISVAYNWNDFMAAIDSKQMVLTPWCTETRCEEEVKSRSVEYAASRGNDAVEEQNSLTGAVKTLCLPFEEELNRLHIAPLSAESQCFLCHAVAKAWTLWGRSY